MVSYSKLSLKAIEDLSNLLKDGRIQAMNISNQRALKDLVKESAIKIINNRPLMYGVENPDLIYRYLSKSNNIKAKSLAELLEYIEFEKSEQIKSRDEIVKHKKTTKDSVSNSFYGLHIAVLKDTQAYQGKELITLKPNISGSYFLFHKLDIKIPDDTVVIGVENPQVLWLIHKYSYLFEDFEKAVFVLTNDISSGYFYTWISKISNKYIHFGDFDFAGLSIYYDKIKPKLKTKETYFLVPDEIFDLIKYHGSKANYDKQLIYNVDRLKSRIDDEKVLKLMDFILSVKIRKCLEQEYLALG
jgi:hypothetical protein